MAIPFAAMSVLHMDQLAIHMLVETPAVFVAAQVFDSEKSTTPVQTYVFDDVRIKAVARLHLAEHHIVKLNLCGVGYWLVRARIAATYSWIQRIP